MEVLLIVWWLAGTVAVGVVSKEKGRDWVGHLLLALVLSPLFIGLMVAALPNRAEQRERREQNDRLIEAIRSLHGAVPPAARDAA